MANTSTNKQSIDLVIPKITEYLLYGATALSPLVFLPFLQNIFDSAKFAFIVLITIGCLGLWTLHTLRHRVLRFTFHPFTFPLILLSLSIVVSSILSPVRLLEDLSGVFGLVLFLNVLILFGASLLKVKNSTRFIEVASVGAILLTIVAILQLINIGPTVVLNQVFTLKFPEGLAFSPSGSPLITLSFLITVLVPLLVSLVDKRELKEKAFPAIAAGIVGIGIILHVSMMAIKPELRPNLLPISVNWIIAIETLKNLPSALFGVGPQNFVDAYTRFRPVGLNTNETWQLLYQAGSNTPLYLWVSIGSVGVIAWLILFIQSILLLRTSSATARPVATMVVTAFIIQLFIPFNMVLLIAQALAMLFWIAILRNEHHPKSADMVVSLNALKVTKPDEYPTEKRMGSLTYLTTFLVLAFVIASLYGTFRVLVGEYFFYRSLEAAQKSDAKSLYEIQQQAIRFNPYRDLYRRAYAQTNLAIALNLARKESLTDQDKTTLSSLLQQSIREARIASTLNPVRSLNWRILGDIYRSLIGSTQGAEQWAVASYVQAVRTHPNDPTLRVDLGGIFSRVKNYEQAGQLFQQAVQLKPDYANGYYNWAQVLTQQERYDLAVLAYEKVLSLLDPSSEDYTKAQQEITPLREKAQAMASNTQKPETPATATISASPEPSPSPASPEDEPQEAELPEEVDNTDTDILNEEPENLELNPDEASQSATPQPNPTTAP